MVVVKQTLQESPSDKHDSEDQFSISVNEEKGEAVITSKVHKGKAPKILNTLVNIPDLPPSSVTFENESNKNEKKDGGDSLNMKNAFILFPSESLYRFKRIILLIAIIAAVGVTEYLLYDFSYSFLMQISIGMIVAGLMYLYFSLKVTVKYYGSLITHDTQGDIEIVRRFAWFKPPRVTMASNVIKAQAEYESAILALFGIGKILFYDSNQIVEPNVFWVSDPKFWVKTLKLHS